MGRLDGKVALISGAARGLGESQATLFAREGARVVLGDVLEEPGQRVAEQITAAGGDAVFVLLDVTSEADWEGALAVALERHGQLNVLVNNAGIPLRKTLEQTSGQEWDHVLAVNLKGTFLGTRAAIPAMRDADGASKGAVRLLTKSTALSYARDGIRCNSIHPGPMDTEVNRESQLDTAKWAERMRNVPLGRIGQPLEVAYGALFLASDESSYMTGSELVIDGGSTAV